MKSLAEAGTKFFFEHLLPNSTIEEVRKMAKEFRNYARDQRARAEMNDVYADRCDQWIAKLEQEAPKEDSPEASR